MYLRKTGAGDFAWEWGSAAAGGVGSVTSAQRDILSNQASTLSLRVYSSQLTAAVSVSGLISTDNRVSNAVSIVSTAASNALSVANAASNAASIVSNAVSVVSQAVSVLSQANSVAHAALSVRVDTQSQSISVISQQVSALSQAHSALSQAVSVLSQATSVAQAALSVRIDTQSQSISVISQQVSALSQAHSALSQAVSVLSNAASNALSVANAASNAASIVSANLATLSLAVSILSQRVSVLVSSISARSVGAVSTRGMQSIMDALSNRISVAAGGSAVPSSAQYVSLVSTVSHLASVVSGASARNTAAVSVKGLQSIFDALSNRISAAGGGAGSVTSTELSAVSAQASSALQAHSALTQARVISVETTISTATLTVVPGFSISVSAGVIYAVDLRFGYRIAVPSQAIAMGFTFPAMKGASGRFFVGTSVHDGSGDSFSSTGKQQAGYLRETQTGLSAFATSVGTSVSATGTMYGSFEGCFEVSTAGTIQFIARASAGSAALRFQPGSFIRAQRLN